MQIVIQLHGSQMQHMTNQQIGAFVAHCYTLQGVSWVKVFRSQAPGVLPPNCEIGLELPDVAQLVDSAKLQGQLEDAMKVFADLEPFPCPCGCGAFISVSPCLRQSGELVDCPLNAEERKAADAGNKIGAIKLFRDRMNAGKPRDVNGALIPGYGSMGLKDAKDIVDAYMDANKRPQK